VVYQHPAPAGPSTAPPPRPAAAGSAHTQPQRQQHHPAPPAPARPADTGSVAAAAEQRLAAAAARGARKPGAPPPAASAPPAQAVLRPAAEFDPFQPAVGGGAALSAIKDAPPEAAAPSSSSPPPRAAPRQPAAAAGPAPTAEQAADIRRCAALVLSQPTAAASLDVLAKLLGNLLANPQVGRLIVGLHRAHRLIADLEAPLPRPDILDTACLDTHTCLNTPRSPNRRPSLRGANPQEPKFRQVRLGNKRIAEAVTDVPGGCELLAACGFAVHHDAADEDGGFAAFLEDERLPLVQEGLAQLRQLAADQGGSGGGGSGAAPPAAAAPPSAPPSTTAAAAGSVSTSSAAAAAVAAPPVDRALKVLLPVASDIQLDASFFERTPADVRAEYASLAARRRAGEVFMSRATREAQQAGRGAAAAPPPRQAAVRVRFPEVGGLYISGEGHMRGGRPGSP
jgi:hypothetical protein